MTHAQTRTRRLRAAAPVLPGGASSLLRLAQPGSRRLPSGEDLSQWVHRAAVSLAADMVAIGDHSSSALVTPLAPSRPLA